MHEFIQNNTTFICISLLLVAIMAGVVALMLDSQTKMRWIDSNLDQIQQNFMKSGYSVTKNEMTYNIRCPGREYIILSIDEMYFMAKQTENHTVDAVMNGVMYELKKKNKPANQYKPYEKVEKKLDPESDVG